MANVLVVEDNPDLLTVLRQLIEHKGHHVHTTTESESALQLLESRTFVPKMILCDLSLPGMGGLAFLSIIRSDPELENVFFIAMSGNPIDRTASMTAGANMYLLKPFSMSDLNDILSEI